MTSKRKRAVVLLTAGAATVALAGATIPRVRAADDLGGYVGKGQLVVQTAIGSGDNKLTVGGDIALEERGPELRLDILSLGIPGTDPALSSILTTQLFPPGGFSVVFDRKTSTYTIWSTAKRNYYTSSRPSATPQSTASPVTAALGVAGDLFAPLALAKSLKDDTAFDASLALAGHGLINGHPATGLDYRYASTNRAGEKTEAHGRLQLADDLDEVPVEITASIKSKSIPESSLRLDLTTLAKQLPSEADFQVPPGFSRANDIGDVIGKTLPH